MASYKSLAADNFRQGAPMLAEGIVNEFVPLTVLSRRNGQWPRQELVRLETHHEVYRDNNHPQHVILRGHHPKKDLQRIIQATTDFTVNYLKGTHNPQLPFSPRLRV